MIKAVESRNSIRILKSKVCKLIPVMGLTDKESLKINVLIASELSSWKRLSGQLTSPNLKVTRKAHVKEWGYVNVPRRHLQWMSFRFIYISPSQGS